MPNSDVGFEPVTHTPVVSTRHEFREALARMRVLGGAKADTPAGGELHRLELAVSRYLSLVETRQT
jgi:hypothetical protein